VFQLAYTAEGGELKRISVYPTLQFLYSHHIDPSYITPDVKNLLGTYSDPDSFCERFMETVANKPKAPEQGGGGGGRPLDVRVLGNHVKQSPQYTIAGLSEGVYLMGMKDQLNIHDLAFHPLQAQVKYIADEMGFVLYEAVEAAAAAGRLSLDCFGPYFIEQYILMEVLSKQEVAQNVMEYYVNQKGKLQAALEAYNENQGKGFICWRFINERRAQR